MFMRYTFCRSEVMYRKFIQNVCIQNLAGIVLLILYTKCRLWHSIRHAIVKKKEAWWADIARTKS